MLKNDLQSMKDGLDVNKIGGTALLGISRPVIKAHGSSNEEAIFSAIRQAVNFSRAGVIEEIEKNIEHMRLDPEEAAEMEETPDSLDVVELSMTIEEMFDLGEISEDDLKGISTIGDLVDYVEKASAN